MVKKEVFICHIFSYRPRLNQKYKGMIGYKDLISNLLHRKQFMINDKMRSNHNNIKKFSINFEQYRL